MIGNVALPWNGDSGVWLDTSTLTPQETVEAILNAAPESPR